MQFQWEFRRGDIDFDSSSNDSKSSLGGEPDHKRHKLVLSSIDVENEETSTFQQKGNFDPANSGQNGLGKPEKGKRGKSKRDNSACNEKKRVSRKLASQKKSTTNANENAALDDLRNHMNSLLEELKVNRKNLLSWMRKEVKKLAAEEKASLSERKDHLQLQHQNNSEESMEVQYQNLYGKNIQIQYQNNFKEHVQGQNQGKFKENVRTQHLINLEEDIEVQPQNKTQDKIQLQHQNCNRDKDGHDRSYNRSNKNKFIPELEHQVDYSRPIVLVAPTEKDGEERFLLPDKSNFKSDLSIQNRQVQQPRSIVLGIRAQNCNNGFAVKSAAKRKKAANSNNHSQVSFYEADKSQRQRSGLSVEPKFPSDSFNQVAPSMYLTLPTVLANPRVANYRPDTSPFSCIQRRIGQIHAGINPEGSKPLLGSSSNSRYFQPEERSGNYARMGLRDVNFLNQNSTTTSIMGNGFAVPLQVDTSGFSLPNQFNLENVRREINNNSMNLTMNGGAARVSGGGYSLQESYIANNFHSHSNHKTGGRLTTFLDSFQFTK